MTDKQDISATIIKPKGYFLALDSWRGIAALMIALLHFNANSHFYDIPIIKHGGLFVDFFFVLSGFVIFANYEDRLKKGFGFFNFSILRFGRLYPLHIVTFLAFVSVDLLQMFYPTLQGFSQYGPFEAPGEQITDIISQIFLFQALDTETVRTAFNGPAWSISAEFYTYLVFGIILCFASRFIYGLSALIAGLSLAALCAIYIRHDEFKFIVGFLRCLYGFAFGGLCWLFWKTYSDKIQTLNLKAYLWTTLELGTIVLMYVFIAELSGSIYRYAAPIIFSLTVIVFAFEKGFISKIIKGKWLLFLGTLSYSIYMNHVFIAAKIFPLMAKLIEKYSGFALFTVIDDRQLIGVTKWHGDIISMIFIVCVFISAIITYKIIEKPFRDMSRNLVKKRRGAKGLPPKQMASP